LRAARNFIKKFVDNNGSTIFLVASRVPGPMGSHHFLLDCFRISAAGVDGEKAKLDVSVRFQRRDQQCDDDISGPLGNAAAVYAAMT
jgi:hypothetical protein